MYLKRSLATISKCALREYPPKKGKSSDDQFRKQVNKFF